MGKTGNITWKNHYFVQKMPNTEGMGICLGLELNVIFSHFSLATVFPNEYNTLKQSKRYNQGSVSR